MRRILVVLALLICGIAAWLYLRPLPPVESPAISEGVGSARGSSAAATPSSAAASAAPINAAVSSEQNPTMADVERLLSDPTRFREQVEALAKQFLARNGESAVNLISLFTVTTNPKYLDRALELYPNSPVVLLAALAQRKDDPNRAAWIENFKTVDPQNPIPWIYTAMDRFAAKQPEEAMAEMREALKRPGFYTFFNERAEAAQKLMRETGAPEVMAMAAGFYGQSADHFTAMHASARGLRAWVEEATGAGSSESAASGAQLLYEYSRMMQHPEASRLLLGQLVGLSVEKQALELMQKLSVTPPNVNPEQRMAEMQQIREEFKEVSTVTSNIPPELMREFLERTKTQGELATLRWLKTKNLSGPVKLAPAPVNQ